MALCVLCGDKAIINRQEGASRTIYNCPRCGVFVISDLVEKEVKSKHDEIRSYLAARRLAKKDADTVLISYEKANLDKSYLQMTVEKIVDFFPATFSEQVEMTLQNLGQMSGFPGDEIKIYDTKESALFYVRDGNPAALLYLMEAMRSMGLIEIKYYIEETFPIGITVAPKGWEKIETPKKNGKGERKNIFAYLSTEENKINAQFYKALEKVAQDCGYHLISNTGLRAEESVTFELVSGIKNSELVVCDFTGQTGSGYYAAATAQSLGKLCILTCHEDSAKKLQFDTKQYRVIIWDKQETLVLELLSTINAAL